MTQYFVCSIGQKGEGYDDENLRRCIINSAYFMHVKCSQKGKIKDIKADDVLILKYKDTFFAYGRASSEMQKIDDRGWCLKVPVEGWITGKSVSKSGIKIAQIGGNNHAAVKSVSREFARKKMNKIGIPLG